MAETPQPNPVEQELSPERAVIRRQAQTQLFADTQVKPFSGAQKAWLSHGRLLSTLPPHSPLPETISAQDRAAIEEEQAAFEQFSSVLTPQDTEPLEAEITDYNTRFAAPIAALKQKLAGVEDPKTLPEYLGSGGNASAFSITVDGKRYAVKIPTWGPATVNFEVKPLREAHGVPNTAQLEGYSFEDNVLIMSMLEGTNAEDFPDNSPSPVSEQHLLGAVDTLLELYNRGVVIDPKISNYIYHPERGVQFLDFHLRDPNVKNEYHRTPEFNVLYLRGLVARRVPPFTIPYGEEGYDAQVIEAEKARLESDLHFLTLLKNHRPELFTRTLALDGQIREHKQAMFKDDEGLVEKKYIHQDDPGVAALLTQLAELGFH